MLTFILLTLYFTGKSQEALEWEGTPGYPVKLVINITKTSSPKPLGLMLVRFSLVVA